jgi:hypothetical protein
VEPPDHCPYIGMYLVVPLSTIVPQGLRVRDSGLAGPARRSKILLGGAPSGGCGCAPSRSAPYGGSPVWSGPGRLVVATAASAWAHALNVWSGHRAHA